MYVYIQVFIQKIADRNTIKHNLKNDETSSIIDY